MGVPERPRRNGFGPGLSDLLAELAGQTAPGRAPCETPSPRRTEAPLWRAARPQGPADGFGRAGVAEGAVARTEAAAAGDPAEGGPSAAGRRIVSLWIENLAIARWLRWATDRQDAPPDTLPLVLAVEGPHGPVVHAVNRAGTLQGIAPGARVVDVRALCPEVRVEAADPEGDRMALGRLMLWARRWCPWTATDGDAGLVLDTTGSDHLWGGETQMLREIEAGFALLGLSVRVAQAPTHGGAWALARFGAVRSRATPDTLAALTAPLPVRALRLDADTVLTLQRLGLKTIGDLAAVPRLSLARRFTRAEPPQNPLLRLDQLQGRLAEPVNAPDPPPRFAVQARLAEPVQDPAPHVPGLCTDLCTALEAEGFGVRRLTLTVYRTDGEVAHLSVATARPSRDPAHLARLWGDRLERIDPGFGFDLMTLAAETVEELGQIQTRLDGRPDEGAALARLVDRLVARLGHASVQRPIPFPSHLPHRAELWRPAMAPPAACAPLADRPRPLSLFDSPEEIRVLYAVPEGPPAQFVWRRQVTRVSRYDGPERIAPEWWADRPGSRLRDYYRVEDQWGLRYWIYRHGVEGDDRGGAGEAPRWFLHGAFP